MVYFQYEHYHNIESPRVSLCSFPCQCAHANNQILSIPLAVFFYSSLFFQGVIDNPLVGTTTLGAINVLATYLALNLLNRYGRRTLIMVSSGGMCFSCVLLIISMRGYFGKMMPLIAVAMCVMFYGIGVGPIPVSYMLICSTGICKSISFLTGSENGL